MTPPHHDRLCLALAAVLFGGTALAANPPAIRDLRFQKVGDTTYFHVRFDTPKGMLPDAGQPNPRWSPWDWASTPEASTEARLVPQDDRSHNVVVRLANLNQPGFPGRPPPGGGLRPPEPLRAPAAVEGIEFVGIDEARGQAKFLLIYPTESNRPPIFERFRLATRPLHWVEAEVALDLEKAKEVSVPKEATARRQEATARLKDRAKPAQPPRSGSPPYPPPVADDLEGLWAIAQVDQFVRLQGEVAEFGFYSFAAETTARKYGVPQRLDAVGQRWQQPGDEWRRQLYETTTGAAAITESLALRRMTGVTRGEETKRTIDIARVEGIDIAEHPWEKMMEGKKPAAEPIARLIPQDNYYVHFKSVRKFIEFNELLDQWGTNLIRGFELHSRDYKLKERYEQQLCLRSTALGKTLGPLIIKGLAVTGSDPYVREGSDVAVIFQVTNKPTFLGAVEPFLEEARKKYGEALKEGKEDYRNPLTFAGVLAAARTSVMSVAPGMLTWEPLEKDYKGVKVVRVQATDQGMQQLRGLVGPGRERGQLFRPAVYYAILDGGFYLTLNEAMLREVIDRTLTKGDGKAQTVEVNSSVYFAPGAAEQAALVLRRYLERQTQAQALSNEPIWYALRHGSLIADDLEAGKARTLAYQYLGYVPVSPDGTSYRYDRRLDEVVNDRHGSRRRPTLHRDLSGSAPLTSALEQLRSVRADLRFREDGVHTVLTIDRRPKEK